MKKQKETRQYSLKFNTEKPIKTGTELDKFSRTYHKTIKNLLSNLFIDVADLLIGQRAKDSLLGYSDISMNQFIVKFIEKDQLLSLRSLLDVPLKTLEFLELYDSEITEKVASRFEKFKTAERAARKRFDDKIRSVEAKRYPLSFL